MHYSYGCDAPPSDSEQIKVYKSEVLKGQCAVYEAIKIFVYIQITTYQAWKWWNLMHKCCLAQTEDLTLMIALR